MNTLELLRQIHDAIGNTWASYDMVPVKLAVLLPELRVEIRRQELKEREDKCPVTV